MIQGLVLGGNSGIARAVLVELDRNGDAEFLRTQRRAEVESDEILQAEALDDPDPFIQKLKDRGFLPDAVLVAWGILVDEQTGSEVEFKRQHEVNCTGTLRWLEALAEWLEQAGHPCRFAILGSVAGDRIRASNKHYGLSKQELERGVRVLASSFVRHSFTLCKPGPILTAMTAELRPSPPLMVQPHQIAPILVKDWLAGKSVSYLPHRWRLIMWILKLIPEAIWKKLPL